MKRIEMESQPCKLPGDCRSGTRCLLLLGMGNASQVLNPKQTGSAPATLSGLVPGVLGNRSPGYEEVVLRVLGGGAQGTRSWSPGY